ncbi:ribosome maturation factor RimM [Clostridia bacterium]|nr:ribosome maturation factor RimM [Clostridia bacterium]
MIAIGKIVTAVGLKGEVKVYSYSDNLENYCGDAGVSINEELRHLDVVRYVKRMPVVKIAGVDDREQGEALRGVEIFIEESDLPELPDYTYYVRDLVGCAVWDEDGNKLGELCDVIQNAAQDIYDIGSDEGKRILLPAVADFVLDVDIAAGNIKVRLPKGLLEL